MQLESLADHRQGPRHPAADFRGPRARQASRDGRASCCKCNSDAKQAERLDFQVQYLTQLLNNSPAEVCSSSLNRRFRSEANKADAVSQDERGFHLLLRQPGDPISPAKRFTGLEATFRAHSKFVFLGEPGSGKSTAMRHMACAFARRRLNGDASVPIPLYLECSSWRYASSLQYFIINDIASLGYSSAVCEFVLNQLSTGGAVLLLDGLNEMGSVGATNTSAISGWLRSDSAPKYLIVSCRSGEFYGSTYIQDLTQIELLPLDLEQIETFARGYLGDRAPKFLDSIGAIGQVLMESTGIAEQKGLKSLISNFYLLLALIILFENSPNEGVPHNVGSLFSRLSDAIFRRELIRGSVTVYYVADIKKRWHNLRILLSKMEDRPQFQSSKQRNIWVPTL